MAWGLEQTRYFTQGCDNLMIVTDHKPLIKILGDRTLDEITNSRLFLLKQRTLPWRFEIRHLPGTSNHAADATSRHPSQSSTENIVSLGSPSFPDIAELALMNTIRNDTQELGAISWSLLATETAADVSLGPLLRSVEQGKPIASDDPTLTSLRPICESLYAEEGVLLYQDRVVVPPSLRRRVLQNFHAAHQGTSSMEQRARAIVCWPGISKDIREIREGCADCNRNAPSQAATPPLPSTPPLSPFEAVFADFFDYRGCHYLVVGDRLSGWVEVLSSTAGTNLAGSAGLVCHLRSFFATFGVLEEISSDGGPEFTAKGTQDFLRLWGVRHRVSSVSFPQSNGRAEVAVKTAKRLLLSNTGPTGSLDHDRFLRAMLQLCNSPDPNCNLSPAQIIFGHPLRDSFSFVNRLEKFSNPHIRPLWRQACAAKEEALRTRITCTTESLKAHSHPLRPLTLDERVFLQNQQGPNPTKWDCSGVEVESAGHVQYRVKVDGSGRITLRNRRFLRAYTPATPSIRSQQPTASQLPTSSADQCLNPPPSLPTLQTPQSTQPTAATPNNPNVVQAPAPLSPLTPARPTQDDSPNLDVQSRDLQLPTSPDEDSSMHPMPPPLPPEPVPRPRRISRPPKRYEPETGKWVT